MDVDQVLAACQAQRDDAVIDALRAGMSVEQVADELGVPSGDLPLPVQETTGP